MSVRPEEEVFKNECLRYIQAGRFGEDVIVERAATWIATMLSSDYIPSKNVLAEIDLTHHGIPQLDYARVLSHYQSLDLFHKKISAEILKMISYFLSQNANNILNYLAAEQHLLVHSIEKNRQYELLNQVIHELAFEISPVVIELLKPAISGYDPSNQTVQSN